MRPGSGPPKCHPCHPPAPVPGLYLACYLVSIWSLSGLYLVSIWSLPVLYLGSTWSLSGLGVRGAREARELEWGGRCWRAVGHRRPGPRCRGGALEGRALSLSPWPPGAHNWPRHTARSRHLVNVEGTPAARMALLSARPHVIWGLPTGRGFATKLDNSLRGTLDMPK